MINILIVEDDNIIALEIQSRLEEQGYNVLGPYAYGEEVIDNIGSLNVDLILMDINLKGSLDGITTAEIIKQKYRKPVIYLTAYSDKNTLERAKITEPYGYIIKPFEDRDLFTSIEMALYKHKIEFKLIESEQWLQTTLKSIGDGVIATDINSNIKFMNKVAEYLTGWSLEDAIGKNLQEVFKIISEISRLPAVNPVDRVIQEGIVTGLANHTLLISKSGREIPIADTASPIKDDDGKVTGCVLVFQDQTQLREYQIALEESESNYRTTLESMDDGIYVLDKDLNVILMNNTFKTWLKDMVNSGISEFDEIKLYDFKEFVNDIIIKEVKQSFETLRPSFKEEEYFINGTKFYTETKRIPVYGNDFSTKLVTIIRNITERKLNQEAIKESESRYRRLHESMTDCFVQLEISGHIIDVNRSFLNMLGYDREEMIGVNYSDLSPSKWSDFEKNIIETQILLLGYSGVYEKEFIRKDGSILPVELRTYVLRDNEGNSTGLWSIVRDITDRKQAEADIQKKNEEMANLIASKDKFFSIIAHDLKGPFSGFLGLTKIIEEEFNEISMADMKELSINLHNSANNLYKLLENLLVWSQVQRGAMELNPEMCFVSLIVQHNIEVHSEVAKNKQIELINIIPANTSAYADIPMLNTLIRNLISNAIKFTPRNGRIEIGVSNLNYSNPLDECFYVKDNGIGMDPATIDKLFKIDQKVSRPGTENEPSSGLGLLLCKEFIEKNNGKIWVESEIDKGSVFYFTLPKKFEFN